MIVGLIAQLFRIWPVCRYALGVASYSLLICHLKTNVPKRLKSLGLTLS